ncbi:glutathione S-transferase family protein [Roseococcus sp. SDR]|uniref:glutathione S-transferase family protein n=1 Tax=Roseococcus sp. SDR TaxID=2835532 RepID=UPI001BCDA96B|nr:glutathione S-transferase family protein [Roseococcus sp. SDR]MBS7791392.1 glutathione S-transferase family protein [Roseococcus sp. SDR]MBV1846706.1 glutathione S-transferase family protein [Roseococcus sp. SDR]
MILLVSARTSSLACRLAFALAGLPGEVRDLSLRQGEHRTPEMLALNPKGQVPALILDSGETITETPAILLAIGEMAPASGLIPAEGVARWRVMEWLSWYAYQFPRAFQPAFRPAIFGPPPAENQIREGGLTRVGEALALIETRLGNRDWLVGNAVTAADLVVAMMTTFAGFVGVVPPDALMAHRRRVFALPALAETLQAEGFAA